MSEIQDLEAEVAKLKVIRKDYYEILEHATEVIFKVDGMGNFYFLSAEFGRVLGYEKDEMLGKHFTNIIHPDDMQLCIDTFNILAQFGKAEENKIFRVRHKNGEYKWVNCSAVCLFDEQGNPTHSIGFAHDITELVRSQQLLAIENQRYIEATRAMAQAVVDAQEKERADIGYELHDNVNQLLSTARLYLDVARNDEKDRLPLIMKSAESISDAVAAIRSISRSLVPSSINDLGLVASVNDLVESIRLTRAVRVEFLHEGDIENLVNPKLKLMLFRIIQEQITNVLKHAEASQLFIDLIADHSQIELSICDDGHGFDPDQVKAKKGMGLHNIASRAELFKGTVHIVSSPGKGCKLNVLIPA